MEVKPKAAKKFRLGSDGIALLMSFVLGFGFQGVMFILISRSLGPTQFGIFAGSFALASAFSTLSGIGGGNVLLMTVSTDRDAFDVSFGTALVYITLTFIPLSALAIPLSLAVSRDFALCLVPLLFAELIGTRIVELSQLAFQAVDRLKVTAGLNGAAGPIRFVSSVGFWLWGNHSAFSWAIVYTAVNLTLSAIYFALAIRSIGRPKVDWTDVRRRWRIGIFFSTGTMSRIVYTDSDKYLLNWFGFEQQAGTYSAASRLVNFAYLPIFSVAYAKITEMFRAGADGYASSWKVVKRLLGPVVLYATVAGVVLYFASPLVILLLGEKYSATPDALRHLAPMILLQGLGLIFGNALMGIGRQGLRSLFQASAAVLSILTNLFVIPRLGWLGAAYTAVGSAFLLAVGLMFAFMWGLRRERVRGTAVLAQPD